jgi:UDP-N-acetylglucosamine diphosphorylase / glucose-1-phosphate thymidylyltransferase / UDP-N-acetylgalactosamine diphosphorylase / glucosamine-1-phosphate N-acetyltransferase / galactosamine-1-phosphate N-acetyltransferase
MALQGVIPVAGRGVRAYPATHYRPKALLEIAGRPLIVRNIEILRDQLGVTDISVVIGHLGDQIRTALGSGAQLGVKLEYVVCQDPTVGLAMGILPVIERMREPFVVILGDELYLESDHAALGRIELGDAVAACGVLQTADKRQIRKNYSVEIADGRIVEVIEKPVAPQNHLLGVGTYLFHPRIGEWIRKTAPSPRSGHVELTDALQGAIAGGDRVLPAPFTAGYFNINSIEEYNEANYTARNLKFADYKVSVVIPAYNEEETIGYVVDDFRPHAHEVMVVNNSSRDRTAQVAAAHGARVETVSLKGYGDTIKYGLDHATGDILVMVEADHSFHAKDLSKLLEYLKDADMAIGTRTTRQLVEQGANMRGLLRWGNIVVGKLVEALWWNQEPRFTDVGCTYRAIWKDSWVKIRDRVTGVGPEFSPEMMIEVLRARLRIVEIPVSYYPRAGGESKISDNYWKISRTALRMLRTIFRKRLFGA